MFSDMAKSCRVYLAAAILPLIAAGFIAWRTLSSSRQQFGAIGESGLSVHTDAIGRMNQSLVKDRELLADYEREQSKLRLEVINRRKLFQDGRLAKDQVHEAEQLFIAALKRVHEMRHAVLTTDIAITEAILGEKVARLPVLAVNGFSETSELARFNGGFKWSLREAPRIERYFSQTFGRRLPVTALGQSETHNRLRFDHRESMDVAVHPDSVEGKALIAHLRKAGIPFMAFRRAIAGTSTGPHIHIGKPSGRLAR
jgi:hypothetical protein